MKKFIVFACAALLLVSFSVPAMADVNLYGRIYFDTYMIDADKEQANLVMPSGAAPTANVALNNSGGFSNPQAAVAGGTSGNDDTDLVWGLNRVITRFGARFKSGKISANVEIRPWSASYFRHWWAAYQFDSFEMRLGKWWDPTFFASQGVMSLFGGGIAYGANPTGDAAARLPMMRFAVPLPNKLGTWYLAFGENAGNGIVAGVPGYADYDVSLPKITTSLRLNFAPTSWLLYGGYQTYDAVGRAASGAETEWSIDSWMVGLSGSAKFGPFGVGANIWTSQNPREYTLAVAAVGDAWQARYNAATNGIEDTDVWGLQLKGTFKFNDMISLELGYGYRSAERKDITDQLGDDEDDRQQFDIVLPINIAKGFTIYPVVTIYDDKDVTVAGVATDEGKSTIYGITWALFF